jgi:hypothetical protein
MRGPKYLLYPSALVVMIWGINGVVTSQPDKPGNGDSSQPIHRGSHGPQGVGTGMAMTVAATVTRSK